MMEVSFYHLSFSPLEKAIPKLLEKVVASNQRAVVIAANDELIDKYNEILWTYSSRTFLAHGSKKDGYCAEQPIYLTASNENPNGAKFIVITGGAVVSDISGFDKCLDIFDGSDEIELSKARERYKNYKQQGHNITYWKQTTEGNWEKGG
jgi:DNA polymerase-3 subunit chi